MNRISKVNSIGTIGIVFILSFRSVSFAETLSPAIVLSSFLSGVPCGTSGELLIRKWGAESKWQNEGESNLSYEAIRTPTQKIGTWIILQKQKETQKLIASRISAHTTLHVEWSDNSCEPKVQILASKQTEKMDGNIFDDHKLEALVKSGRPGIIYYLNPHMHLSLDGISEVRNLANELNLKLTLISETKAQDPSISIARSQELAFRGIGIHAPNLVVYSRNGISGIYPGRKTKSEYRAFVEQVLK